MDISGNNKEPNASKESKPSTHHSHKHSHSHSHKPSPEDEITPSEAAMVNHRFKKTSEIFETDRGRLFIRVISVNNIATSLPSVETKNAKVCMILDNGLHSITTPYKAMQRRLTSLDQEFELIVGANLEFILTLKAKWPKPKEPIPTTLLPPPSNAHGSRAGGSSSRVVSTASLSSQLLRPISSIASSVNPNKQRHGLAKFFGRSRGGDKDKSGSKLRPMSSSKNITPVTTSQSIQHHNPAQLHQQQIIKPVIDPWTQFFAQDGSFGRAYISFADYEKEIYGVEKHYSFICYNEWTATAPPTSASAASARLMASSNNPRSVSSSSSGSASSGGSSKSKLSSDAKDNRDSLSLRKSPYPIATLECQMMFIPRGTENEQLPGSIEEATQILQIARQQVEQEKEEERIKIEKEKEEARKRKEAEKAESLVEGCLSQLGGDCKYWRRRYFKLNGVAFTLTAYSESSRKPRVSINLRKAVRIIEDKKTLTNDDGSSGSSNSKNRRRSAFAEQEEGFMFVNEGFRVRFANGEIIDFYADDQATKKEWVKGLRQVIANIHNEKIELEQKAEEEKRENISNNTKKSKKKVEIKPWMEQVLAHEEEQEEEKQKEPLHQQEEGTGVETNIDDNNNNNNKNNNNNTPSYTNHILSSSKKNNFHDETSTPLSVSKRGMN